MKASGKSTKRTTTKFWRTRAFTTPDSLATPSTTTSLQIDPNEDFCTLVTCYPFGVNTHRLLIRGTRIDLDTGEELAKNQKGGESTWDLEYKKAITLGLILLFVILFVFFTICFIVRKIKKAKRKKSEQRENPSDEITQTAENSE